MSTLATRFAKQQQLYRFNLRAPQGGRPGQCVGAWAAASKSMHSQLQRAYMPVPSGSWQGRAHRRPPSGQECPRRAGRQTDRSSCGTRSRMVAIFSLMRPQCRGGKVLQGSARRGRRASSETTAGRPVGCSRRHHQSFCAPPLQPFNSVRTEANHDSHLGRSTKLPAVSIVTRLPTRLKPH